MDVPEDEPNHGDNGSCAPICQATRQPSCWLRERGKEPFMENGRKAKEKIQRLNNQE